MKVKKWAGLNNLNTPSINRKQRLILILQMERALSKNSILT
jgi:hypothetical protein